MIANSTFELNEEEVNLYINDLKSQYEQMAAYYGYDLETYVGMATGMSFSEFEAQCREIALQRIQSPLVLSGIAQTEGLEMTDEVYQEKAQEYVDYYGYGTIEELEEAYTKETVVLQVTSDLALEFLVKNAVAEEN